MLALTAPASQTAPATPAATTNALPAIADLLPKPPPTARDFSVFHRAAIEGKPTREVAWQFQISQTRVCQIIKRIRTWLWEVLPELAGQPTTERQLQMARALAADRLEHLYQESLQAWHTSQGQRETTRRVAGGPLIISSHSTTRDTRYLTAAGRIALLQARLGLSSGILCDAQAELPDDKLPEPHPFIGDEHIAEPTEVGPCATAPPVEDCSASDAEPVLHEQPSIPAHDETALPTTTYAPLTSITNRTPRELLTPIQAASGVRERSPVVDIRLKPDIAGYDLRCSLDSLPTNRPPNFPAP